MSEMTRAERRRKKREMRKAKKMAQHRSAQRRTMFIWFAVIAIIAIAIVSFVNNPTSKVPSNAIKVPIMRSNHTSDLSNVKYNSNPPTSGPHFGNWNKKWDFYSEELPVGGLLHNMEHGGVIIFYKPDVDDATKEQLKKFTKGNFKMIASVNSDIPAKIAMASWGAYEYFDEFDEAGMKRFYKQHINTAPESVYP